MAKKKIINIMLNTLTLIGVACQFLSNIPEYLNNALLTATFICIIIFWYSNFVKRQVYRKKVIKLARRLLSNISTKAILFGGDLSWTNDYLDIIEKLSNENKNIEIFLPENKIKKSSNEIAKNILLERINRLSRAGAKIYLTPNDYHIRCIIIDPDIIAEPEKMQMFSAERIKRNVKDVNKNKYKVEYIDFKSSQEVCKMLIALYKIIKDNAKLFNVNVNSVSDY